MTSSYRLTSLSTCPNKFEEAFSIYEVSLPASERKNREDIFNLLAREDYAVTVLEMNDRVIGFSIVFLPQRHPIGLLEYMATDQAYRNMGMGEIMFEHALSLCAERVLLVEVEAAFGSPASRKLQRRRQDYYGRLGCRPIAGLAYRMPQLQAAPPPPLILMCHPNGNQINISKELLRDWVACIYSGVYGRADNDEIIDAMFANWSQREQANGFI
ncbi:MAG: GNAT family N-acetyltransferase [Hyphomonas sp.]|jgi:GNAT superfamily N-acetyltransferase|uniref:GNAT family N-acetyltransferase n=1 Tax=Hyphomonas sp. TaxID=87 RepID=UPI0032657548